MKHAATACACTLLFLPLAPAQAGSVNDPGFTTGVPVYDDFPEGLYLGMFPQYGERRTSVPGQQRGRDKLAIHSLFFFYESPLKVASANLALAAAPVFVQSRQAGGKWQSGFYNTYVGAQFTWQLPHNWGLGFRLSGFVPQDGKMAFHFGTAEIRAGATYLTGQTDFTANLIAGHPIEHGPQTAPDYVDLDLTYSRNFGKWQLGAVGFGSLDSDRPYRGYARQGQFAAGPLVGYTLGRFLLQVRLTRDIAQRNMGGPDSRIWGGITVPLWTPQVPAAVPIEKHP